MLVLTSEGNVKQYPYSVSKLKRDNPQVSFPANPSPELLEEFGVYSVVEVERPEINGLTQDIREINPKLIDGEWVQNWAVKDLTPEELELIHSNTAETVRTRRSTLLAESDWTQVADAPVDRDAWRAYRNELRDIPNQEGFPFDVVWPTQPSN